MTKVAVAVSEDAEEDVEEDAEEEGERVMKVSGR